MDTHVWVHHPATGNHWQCPVAALEDQLALGWELAEPPQVPHPAVAERVAFLAEQAAAVEAEKKSTTKPRRGESE
jgi:hypothetical protein